MAKIIPFNRHMSSFHDELQVGTLVATVANINNHGKHITMIVDVMKIIAFSIQIPYIILVLPHR